MTIKHQWSVVASNFEARISLKAQFVSIVIAMIITSSDVKNCPSNMINDGTTPSGTCTDNGTWTNNRCSKVPLYILVMAPYPDSPPFNPSWEGGPAVIPAALVAKDCINNRDDILKDYTLNFLVLNSGCDIVLKARHNLTQSIFYSGKKIAGIIGPGCSEAALAVAPLVIDDRISLLQIAPTATSPLLINSSLYPNTFRPIVSSLRYVDTYLDIIKRQNYKHVGAIYEAERAFQVAVYTRFESDVQKAGIRVSSIGLFNTSVPIDEFLIKIRVIFVFASTDFASIVLCLASKLGLLYPEYQLIFSNRRYSDFMTDVTFHLEGTVYNCSREEMERAIIGMVFNNFRLTRQDRDCITDVGMSYNQYIQKYNETLDIYLESLGLTTAINTEHHSNYFDATWALALGLNNSLPHLNERGLSLANYTYLMPEITQILREELLKLSFEGMRGIVQFSEATLDGANVTVIDIYQVLDIDGSLINGTIGYYDPMSDTALILYPNASLLQAVFNLRYTTPHISLGIITMIVIGVLFVILVACHIANVVWANYRTVKATSPNLNHLIFSSCYLSLVGAVMYTNAFVFLDISEDSNIIIPVHCSALQWSGTMVYSLLFGTLLAKRWRIYRLFGTFTSSQIKRLGDNILVSIALIPLHIDIFVNVLWNTIDPWYFSVKHGPGLEALVTCGTNHEVVWALCIAIPKGILTMIVLYLTIATRRVRKREFKQTKSINILIFSLLVLIGISLPLFIILQFTILPWAVSVSYVSFCLLDLGPVVLCIVLLLLPPLIPPIKDKILRFL